MKIKESLNKLRRYALAGTYLSDIPLNVWDIKTHTFNSIRKDGNFYTADGIEIRDALYMRHFTDKKALHPLEQEQL